MSVSNFRSLAGLELHLRTIPGRVGWGRVGSVQSDYKAISVQLQLQLPAGTELGKKLHGIGRGGNSYKEKETTRSEKSVK